MKLFRARFGFYDAEFDPKEKLVQPFIPQGSVIALDETAPDPSPEYWELIFQFERPTADYITTQSDVKTSKEK